MKRVEVIVLQHLDQEQSRVNAVTSKVIPIQLPLQLQQLQARFARPATSFAHRLTTPITHPEQETTDARSEIIAESRP